MRNEMQKSYAFKGVCNFTKIREEILFFRAGREFIIHSFVSSKPRNDGIFFERGLSEKLETFTSSGILTKVRNLRNKQQKCWSCGKTKHT